MLIIMINVFKVATIVQNTNMNIMENVMRIVLMDFYLMNIIIQ